MFIAYRRLDQRSENKPHGHPNRKDGSDVNLVVGGVDILRRWNDRGFHDRLGSGSFRQKGRSAAEQHLGSGDCDLRR